MTKDLDRQAGTVGPSRPDVVFGLVGIFLMKAAIDLRPSARSASTGHSRSSTTRPTGPWLLGLVAAGLVLFGVFVFGDRGALPADIGARPARAERAGEPERGAARSSS